MSEENGNKWHIFFFGLDKAYVLGVNGRYETNLENALSFDEKIDAIEFVEKHGYEKITTIRKVRTA